MGEEWRPVVGWEGIYEVSSFGCLRRVSGGARSRQGRIIYGSRQKNGYYKIGLYAGDRVENFWLHHIVARAFLGPTPSGKEINHIDLDRSNNRSENFEFLTHQENIQHAMDNGRMARGESSQNAVLTDDMAREIFLARRGGEPVSSISRRLNVNPSTTRSVAHGRSWRHITSALEGKK